MEIQFNSGIMMVNHRHHQEPTVELDFPVGVEVLLALDCRGGCHSDKRRLELPFHLHAPFVHVIAKVPCKFTLYPRHRAGAPAATGCKDCR